MIFQGSVAAQVLDQTTAGIQIQHHWVTSTGEAIGFKSALLKPASTGDVNIAVGKGGTRSYENATGFIDCFGLADFKEETLGLRFCGELYTDKKTK